MARSQSRVTSFDVAALAGVSQSVGVARLHPGRQDRGRYAAEGAGGGAQAQLRAQLDRQQPHHQAHQHRGADPRQSRQSLLCPRAACIQQAHAGRGAAAADLHGRAGRRKRRGDPARPEISGRRRDPDGGPAVDAHDQPVSRPRHPDRAVQPLHPRQRRFLRSLRQCGWRPPDRRRLPRGRREELRDDHRRPQGNDQPGPRSRLRRASARGRRAPQRNRRGAGPLFL